MKLNKKQLVSRTFNVGMDRIVFNKERLADIKEAITKQDIRDLVADKAISILDVKGRRKVIGKAGRRRRGSVRKNVKNGKEEYVKFIRRLRAYLKELKKQKTIDDKQFRFLRNSLRSRKIHTKAQLKEQIAQLKK